MRKLFDVIICTVMFTFTLIFCGGIWGAFIAYVVQQDHDKAVPLTIPLAVATLTFYLMVKDLLKYVREKLDAHRGNW